MKILAIKPDHLGDFVLALPALWELSRLVEKPADLAVLALRSNAEWTQILPWLPRIHIIHHPRYEPEVTSMSRPVFDAARLAFSLREEKFTHAFELSASRHDLWGKMWMVLAGAKIRQGLKGRYEGLLTQSVDAGSGHQVMRLRRQAGLPDRELDQVQPSEFMPPQYRWNGRESSGLLLCPFAGQKSKLWKEANWVELAKKCADAGQRVHLLVPPGLEAPAARIARLAGLTTSSLLETSTLRQTLEILSHVSRVVALDTAVAHLAWLVGTPLIQLFSAAGEPERWRSLGAHVFAYQQVACAPCKREVCTQPVHECMDQISVERLFSALV